MNPTSRYARDDADLEEFALTVGWAFGTPAPSALKWLQPIGAASIRLLREAGRLHAGLCEIPMAQWFGGENVATLGIAGVAVQPESRGAGHAKRLLVETLAEARARGVALSTLYPATVTLYRGVGYELAGSRYRYSADLARLPRWPSDLSIEPLPESREPEAEAMYRELAREQTGYLDRCAYIWDRVRAPDREPAQGFMVVGARGAQAYFYVKQHRIGEWAHELLVTDLVANTGEAAKRVLTFLADHRSTLKHAHWHAGPFLPWLFEFPERVFEVTLSDYWMLRIVHVAAALEQRGYPKLLETELDLEIDDPILPDNSGRYLVRLHAGRASVEPAPGAGRVRLNTRGLAALYTGFATPAALARAGLVTGQAADLERLGAVFASSAPGLVDHF
jgi:predicted acetyltransferase